MLVTFVKQLRHFGFIVPRQGHWLLKWPRRTLTNGNAHLNGTCRTGGAGPREHEVNSEADESVANLGAGSEGIGDVASIDLKKRACVHQKRLRRNFGGRYLMSYKSEWKECAETPLSRCLSLYFHRF